MIEVHYGTPNEMARAASKPTQPAAVKWARDHLAGMGKQAEKYDRSAVDAIRSVREQMLQTTAITRGDKRTWEIPYLDMTVRIELRHT
jgi:hypothetical protein